jgi:AbiV family abortive infection protein
MKRRLNQYADRLTADEIAAGMNAARENARRLTVDARLLFDNGRYASALALSILAIEEVGKEPILRTIAVASDSADLKSGWRDYRSHTKKNVLWPLIEWIQKGARRATDFQALFDDGAEHPRILDQVKQLCLYTDCLGKRHWALPDKVVNRDLASVMLSTAELLIKTREITKDEIELWIHYLKPHWKDDVARTRALFNWDKEMRRRGILVDDEKCTMQQFFEIGIKVPLTKTGKATH